MALTAQQTANAQKYTQAGIQGAAAGVGVFQTMKNELGKYDNLDVTAPDQQFDAYGRPTYDAGGLLSTYNQLESDFTDPKRDRKLLNKMTTEGGKAGVKAGANFGPWGAAIGGAIGWAGGAVGALFGGKKRRRTMLKKGQLAQSNLLAAQQMYNTSMGTFNNQQFVNQEYGDLMSGENRINNIYQANTGQ